MPAIGLGTAGEGAEGPATGYRTGPESVGVGGTGSGLGRQHPEEPGADSETIQARMVLVS